ncbi:MAG: IMS domain-containing protein [Prochlorococcus sp.]
MGTLVGGNSVINNYGRIKDNKKGINKDGGFSNQVALVIMLTLYPLGICFSAIVTTLLWPVVEDNFVSSGVKESLYSDHKEGRSERESNLDEQESIEIVRKWWSKRSSIFAPPYNTYVAQDVIAQGGPLWRDLTKTNGPVDWLRKNNTWHSYQQTNIEKIKSFDNRSNPNRPVLVLLIRTKTTKHTPKGSKVASSTKDFTYSFAREYGVWKIWDYKF